MFVLQDQMWPIPNVILISQCSSPHGLHYSHIKQPGIPRSYQKLSVFSYAAMYPFMSNPSLFVKLLSDISVLQRFLDFCCFIFEAGSFYIAWANFKLGFFLPWPHVPEDTGVDLRAGPTKLTDICPSLLGILEYTSSRRIDQGEVAGGRGT